MKIAHNEFEAASFNLKQMVNKYTLLTNFEKEELPVYKKAVALYGKKDVYIAESAYTPGGYNISDTHCSLHRVKGRDYSEFWKCYECIKSLENSNGFFDSVKAKIRYAFKKFSRNIKKMYTKEDTVEFITLGDLLHSEE